MNVSFKKSFLKDLDKLNNKRLQEAVYQCIRDTEIATDLSKIKNIKKLKGFDSYFRIRIGEYRIGLKFEQGVLFFVVLDHRKDIYKGFP